MNREQVKHITDNQYRKLKKHLKSVDEGFEIEAIHQFRVEYKRLRAFLRMLSLHQETAGEIKISKTLKKAYTILGTIRDLQLQQLRILEATKQERRKPKAYLNLLQKEIESLKPELAEIFLGNPVTGSKRKTNDAIPDEFPLKNFRNFINHKWATIYAIIISDHFSDDNIHLVRKELKDLYYNLRLYKGNEHEMLSARIHKGKDEQYFKQLLEELGSFQDKCTAIALLRSYWLNRLNTFNQELMERVKKIWLKEKVSMKKLLVKKLKMDIDPPQAGP